MSAPTLSACTYTKNNEDVIAACLDSLAFADEVLLLDSGSTDNTVAIAKEKGVRVEHRDWTGFRDQLNHIQKIAKNQWVLIIDADERVSPELAQEVQAAIQKSEIDAFDLPRKNKYLGRWLKHGEMFPDYTLRLYQREKGHYEREPHAVLRVPGKTEKLTEPIEHLFYKSLGEQMERIDLYSKAAAEELAAKSHGLHIFDALFRPWVRFIKCYILKLGFLDGWPGFVVAATSAFAVFMKYARVYEVKKKTARL